MLVVLKNAGINNPTKTTHHRAQCVLYAGSRGLTEYQISSLTRHITKHLAKNYMPEVDMETCKAMSGFSKTETRFVPSKHIVFPNGHVEYVKTCMGLMIPNCETYVQEAKQL
jgi:hypothetical protein